MVASLCYQNTNEPCVGHEATDVAFANGCHNAVARSTWSFADIHFAYAHMSHPAKFITFAAFAFTSIASADESILDRLQNAGVRIRFARVDADGVTSTPTGLAIPRGWNWTDQSVLLVRELISSLDTPPTLYICGPRDSGHEKAESLKKDFPNLSIKRIAGTFLGVTYRHGPVACQVYGLIPGSPAESAGLRKGDTIVGVNDIAIANFKMLQKAIQEFLPDETVEIHVKREFKDLKFNVTLTSFPLPPITRGEPSDAPESSKTPAQLDAVPLGPGDR